MKRTFAEIQLLDSISAISAQTQTLQRNLIQIQRRNDYLNMSLKPQPQIKPMSANDFLKNPVAQVNASELQSLSETLTSQNVNLSELQNAINILFETENEMQIKINEAENQIHIKRTILKQIQSETEKWIQKNKIKELCVKIHALE
ncbi:Hypothetical_protein [Hexamita inflata]|uniref:Hypothetical_protein n=1 Tax=Hexamita inflata TaxID=28002 RepID=A0AA86PQ12_9EUKA|nr:Hypothetical protein HINF_LOCUS31895 [Hexamita inflata]